MPIGKSLIQTMITEYYIQNGTRLSPVNIEN